MQDCTCKSMDMTQRTDDGSYECDCGPGTLSVNDQDCELCAKNTFQDGPADAVCKNCPSLTATVGAGTTSGQDCHCGEEFYDFRPYNSTLVAARIVAQAV